MNRTERNGTSNQEMVHVSHAEYEKLQAQGKKISELESRLAIIMDAVRLERHRQFGASSEKMTEDAMDQLSFLFNEYEVYSDVAKAQEEATLQRRKKNEYTLDSIPDGMSQLRGNHDRNWHRICVYS